MLKDKKSRKLYAACNELMFALHQTADSADSVQHDITLSINGIECQLPSDLPVIAELYVIVKQLATQQATTIEQEEENDHDNPTD